VLTLKGERWLEQPADGVMLDLTAAIKPTNGTLHGFAGDLSRTDCKGFLVGRPLAAR
jgi:hypothetical protein